MFEIFLHLLLPLWMGFVMLADRMMNNALSDNFDL